MARALVVLTAVLATGAWAAAGPLFLTPPFFTGWDADDVALPFDRCPDRGFRARVDDDGCPLAADGPWGDLDGDGLLNGHGAAVARDSPLARSLVAAGIVNAVEGDGRLRFFGEIETGTSPTDPNSDGLDLLGDGLELALLRGLTPAARSTGFGAAVVDGDGVPLADPLAPDDYLEVHPALVGTRTYWNDALEAALRQVVADDAAPEGNATYAPPSIRLHAWLEPSVALPDGDLGIEELRADVAQHVNAARRGFVTYVIVAPRVLLEGNEQAGLAQGNWVLVAVEHKGFHRCEEEGGEPGTPACEELMRLFRWTLNHERMHRWGLVDTFGRDELMSTAPGVYTPRPHESAARIAWIEEHPERVVLRAD
ncbi:MAG TPA: hypothetical protein VI997_08445 [Candidatus Thermoplasmatota archaeon]|nr:hypothetical protein [Candidatus Thermoplasmatota archaeon]